jgi:hypothetical protein
MMGEYHREWTDQFSDYLSGDLDEAARARIDEHVTDCVRCREVLTGLTQVVAMARDATELEPPRDLWPAVAASLDSASGLAGRGDDGVITLPTARDRPVGLMLSRSQLALAASFLVALSVSGTWWAASGGAADPVAAGSATGLDASPATVVSTAADEPGIPVALADQLRVLEDVMTSARAALDPATVQVLERNLMVIETAITDSRDALASDPGNAFLMEHLERMYRRKVIYLQEAVRVAEWAG